MDAGRVIREARRAHSLNQQQLAERIGSTQRQISLWETGKRSPQVSDLERIATALHRELRIAMEPRKPKRPASVGVAAFDEVFGKRNA